MMITTDRNGAVATVSLEGRLDLLGANKLQNGMTSILQGVRTLTLDFAKVGYVSSAGLRVLLFLHKDLLKRQGSMTLVNVGPAVMEVLVMTRFCDILSIRK